MENEIDFFDGTLYKDGPREKLERNGVSSLTDKELVMVLIGSGNSKCGVKEISDEVLKMLDKNPNVSYDELRQIRGLGNAKTATVLASIELGRRKIKQKPKFLGTPGEIYQEIKHYASREQEHFIVILFNGALETLGTFVCTIGLIDKSLVHPREVFSPAIGKRAIGIAIAHNHPSGILTPSKNDIDITNRLIKAGNILGIKVLDHIVFSDEGYYSFMENGLMGRN